MRSLINEGNNSLFDRLSNVLDQKIDTLTNSINQITNATNENTKKIHALEEQVATLEATNSLQSDQMEALGHHRKNLRKTLMEELKNFKTPYPHKPPSLISKDKN